tara:strand:+ start:466 stop:675 length:210 start_codon:yes stop_codon:yes gene_type:complete
MKTKNVLVIVLLFFVASVYLIFFYINSNDKDINSNGIVSIKSNLQNYKIIPIDKGGIKAPCLEILGCEK